MKQFRTIEKLDTGILYSLELASSISVLLLAFGLIASMANVLTKGSALKVKIWLYGLLSVLLLFTAAIVSNIEAVQQTLNVTLDTTYVYVFIPVEVLIWVRSIAIVLLIVAHAMRHVQIGKPTGEQAAQPQTPALVITPELLDTLCGSLQTTSVQEEQATPLFSRGVRLGRKRERITGSACKPILPNTQRQR